MEESGDGREILHDKDITKLDDIKTRIGLGWNLAPGDREAIADIAQRCNCDDLAAETGQPIEWFLQLLEPASEEEQPTRGPASEEKQPTRPVPSFGFDIADELIHGINLDDYPECVGVLSYERKNVVRRILYEKPYHELVNMHLEMFKDLDPSLPPWRINKRTVENREKLDRFFPWAMDVIRDLPDDPLNEEDGVSPRELRRLQMAQNVSRAKLAITQADRPSPERKALTEVEKKWLQRWGTIDPEEIKVAKAAKKAATKQARRAKKTKDQKDKRAKNRTARTSNSSDGSPHED
jgi:hypothetical protein